MDRADSLAELLRKIAKNGMASEGMAIIEIASRIGIVWTPTGTHYNVLIPEGAPDIAFVENGSQHSMLCLADVTKLDQGFPSVLPIEGTYDRNPVREITRIYLPVTMIEQARYPGTLNELLNGPNIASREGPIAITDKKKITRG